MEAVIYSIESVIPLQCICTINTFCDQLYSTIIHYNLSVSQVTLLQGKILQYFNPFPTCSSEQCLLEFKLRVSLSLLHVFVVQLFYYINSKKSFQWKELLSNYVFFLILVSAHIHPNFWCQELKRVSNLLYQTHGMLNRGLVQHTSCTAAEQHHRHSSFVI